MDGKISESEKSILVHSVGELLARVINTNWRDETSMGLLGVQ